MNLLPTSLGKMHVENESFNDTIVDVINYMVLLSAFLKDKEEGSKKDAIMADGYSHQKVLLNE